MSDKIKRLVITAGEPAGIGPDLCVQLAQVDLPYEIVVAADAQLLASRARQLNLPLAITYFDSAKNPARKIHRAGGLLVQNTPVASDVIAGECNVENVPYVLKTIDIAVEGCQNGTFDALVTGPVHKGIINDAGVSFSGHTEYLAEATGGQPVMMLATKGLRVALVTTHLPLANVAAAITRERLTKVVEILMADLQDKLGIREPRVLVCGLNPHAGEDGHLGLEEIETITPVLRRFTDKGMKITGPLSADTLFTPEKLAKADAVLAMYHDQGLPVLKHMGFGEAVNITLGLPLIRTSVDHGTALELAGSGQAKSDSLLFALSTAANMANHVSERAGKPAA